MESDAHKVAEWIWEQIGLDHDESWQGMVFEDAEKQLEEILG